MNISIVIPNYNGKELLEKNLPKVYEALAVYGYEKTEMIVVDDASTDDSIAFLNGFSKGKNIKISINKSNLGFSATVNRGVGIARGDIIILLNTDVCPEKNFLIPLVGHFKDENVFAVGCLDKSMEGDRVVERGRGLGEWKRGFLVHRRGEVNSTSTLWVNGGSGAFRKSIWDKLGGLNELYSPFYWEDIDLSYRALKSGYRIIFEPKSIVIHEHEKGAIKSKYLPSQVKIIVYRNQFIFVWANADLNNLFSHIFWLPYHFIKALIRFDRQFYSGFARAFLLIPKILEFRSQAGKNFVKKDEDIIRELA